jgi:hypothetical protein
MELEGLKVGDKLICAHNYGGRYDVHVVTRLTATLAICGERASFALKTGKKRGSDGWSTRWAKIPTADDLAKIELRNRIQNSTTGLQRIRLTAKTIDAAEALIKAALADGTVPDEVAG